MPTYQLILFIFCCAAACARLVAADDWTASCPTGCTCKWTNGKKSVKCNDLQLTSIPTTLHTDVQSLQLNGNNIAVLVREEFTGLGLVNLQRIYLKRSHISNISKDAFRNLKILVELDLSENAIEQLDKNTFGGNDRLRYLYLYGNPLKRLGPNQFPKLPHLRTLDMHDCQIDHIDATAFANLELLELLNLKNNLVEIVDEHVFNYMKNLKTLVLEGNPWKCNCKLRRFRNWYINSNLNSLSLMCSSPFVFKNKQWEEVDEIQFACPPKVDIYTDNIYNIDIGSNVTFGCLIYGDPLPAATWDFNGKEFEADNVSVDEEMYTDTLWRNLTIFNITNFDAGVYACSAKNNVGRATANISLTLTEMVQHVIEKGPETFWYFGLILGTFGTVFGLIVLAILVCWCQKASRRRRSLKNIKGSVSFNDQEKKLLDLSITTNDRQDSCEMGGAGGLGHHASATAAAMHNHHMQQQQQQQQQHNQHNQQNGLPLEPIQITIENQQHQQQRIGSPMAMAMAMVTAESTTTTTSASNSSTSGQSTSSCASQQSTSVRGGGGGSISTAAANSAAAAAAAAAAAQHHHRGTCPLSRGLPTFRVAPGGPMPPYGSIFIALAMGQDEHGGGSATGAGGDYRIYPDLLNDTSATQPQVLGTLFAAPEGGSSGTSSSSATHHAYTTLPRNRSGAQLRAAAGTASGQPATVSGTAKFTAAGRLHEYEPPDVQHGGCNDLCLQNIINYHNLEARLCGGDASSLCALCLRDTQDIGVAAAAAAAAAAHHHHHQQQQHHHPYRVVTAANGATLQRVPSETHSEEPPPIGTLRRATTGGGGGSAATKYDNMGRRITASGNSTLSLPDEDDEMELRNGLRGNAAANGTTTTSTSTMRRGSFARDTTGSGGGTLSTGAQVDQAVPSVSRLVLPVGCDYVSL